MKNLTTPRREDPSSVQSPISQTWYDVLDEQGLHIYYVSTFYPEIYKTVTTRMRYIPYGSPMSGEVSI